MLCSIGRLCAYDSVVLSYDSYKNWIKDKYDSCSSYHLMSEIHFKNESIGNVRSI